MSYSTAFDGSAGAGRLEPTEQPEVLHPSQPEPGQQMQQQHAHRSHSPETEVPSREEIEYIFQLCRADDWHTVLAQVQQKPWIALTPMVMDNHISTTIIHQAITSKSNTAIRAEVIATILTATPQAASIRNGYGSLPLHVICQRNTKMDAQTKERLVFQMVPCYPAALMEQGGVGKRTPLHIIFTDYISPRMTRMMIDAGSQACFMKDKKGLLPAHVACMRHCSPDKLRMLLAVNPSALFEPTNAGETLLTLAKKSATKAHPNYALIDELNRQLMGGPNDPESKEMTPSLSRKNRPQKKSQTPQKQTSSYAQPPTPPPHHHSNHHLAHYQSPTSNAHLAHDVHHMRSPQQQLHQQPRLYRHAYYDHQPSNEHHHYHVQQLPHHQPFSPHHHHQQPHHHHAYHQMQPTHDGMLMAPNQVLGRVSSEDEESWNRHRLDSNDSNSSWMGGNTGSAAGHHQVAPPMEAGVDGSYHNHYGKSGGGGINNSGLASITPTRGTFKTDAHGMAAAMDASSSSRKRKAAVAAASNSSGSSNPDRGVDLLLHFSRGRSGSVNTAGGGSTMHHSSRNGGGQLHDVSPEHQQQPPPSPYHHHLPTRTEQQQGEWGDQYHHAHHYHSHESSSSSHHAKMPDRVAEV